MKEIEKFIIKSIDNLSNQFSNLSFLYGYDNIAHQHIIFVEPDVIYNSENYIIKEMEIIDEFISLFPFDEILFTNNRYIRIENPIYSVKAESYVFNDFHSMSNPALLTSSLIPAPIDFLHGFVLTKSVFIQELKLQEVISNHGNILVFSSEMSSGENNYAMAA
jgi:hypothetical protein